MQEIKGIDDSRIPPRRGSRRSGSLNGTSGTAKFQRYMRRLFSFKLMDFELAFWQMTHLLISPERVYENIVYQKRKHYVLAGICGWIRRNKEPVGARWSGCCSTNVWIFCWYFGLFALKIGWLRSCCCVVRSAVQPGLVRILQANYFHGLRRFHFVWIDCSNRDLVLLINWSVD